MKKIIVIGATGETGRYFIDYCMNQKLNEEFNIIAVGHRQTTFFTDYYGIQYISLDTTKKEEFAKLPLEDVHAVVDLAAYMPARSDGNYIEKMLTVNLMGTMNILDYCLASHADRILYAQSFGDIVQHANDDTLLKVNMTRNFSFNTDHTVYLISKCAAVDLIEYYHQHFGLKRFIFRLPNIYVYAKDRFFYQDGKKTPWWYRILIDQACAGDDIEIWGDSSRVKDMVYVKDFAQMLYLGCFIDRDEGFYNVGTGVGTSLKDQIEIMVDLLGPEGHKSRITLRPDKPDTPQYVMDIESAVEELGYQPKFFYKEMLLDYVKEMQEGRFDTL